MEEDERNSRERGDYCKKEEDTEGHPHVLSGEPVTTPIAPASATAGWTRFAPDRFTLAHKKHCATCELTSVAYFQDPLAIRSEQHVRRSLGSHHGPGGKAAHWLDHRSQFSSGGINI
jgi:hypothetical protein